MIALSPSGESRPAGQPPRKRAAAARKLRKRLPRSRHGAWLPPSDRPDPIALLEISNRGRLPSLVPLRYGRMLASPFAFLRGAAAIMARDLATTPVTGPRVQLCGDAHLGNFGGCATPERTLVFDLNDFDETLAGPWEWDVKRLAASAVVLGRENGLDSATCKEAALACGRSYREHTRAYARMPYLDVWYDVIDAETTLAQFDRHPDPIEEAFARAEERTNLATLPKLAEKIGGGFRLQDEPPLVSHRRDTLTQQLHRVLASYRVTLPEERRVLLDRYQVADVARKVVGVGSVGHRCYVVLLFGANREDPLFLQIKEARASVLAPFAGPGEHAHHGKRVVVGQRMMQAASDLFLGWTRYGRTDYFVRQLRDMKASVALEDLGGDNLCAYAALCGWVLARAHACSGDASQIGGYLGKGTRFERALATFADAYADQTAKDHASLAKAVKSGRIRAEIEE
jgi:uncharacterized protein (DUF2252 family)